MIQLNAVEIGYASSLLKIAFNTLEIGMAYALIGANGSGKSTFLKTIAGQVSPIKGEILIQGQSFSNLHPNNRAKLVAFVPSRFPEIANMRTIDFIGLGRTPYLNALGRLTEKDKQMVNASIQELNIEHLEQKMISELSDGEKQLCAIARAICQETPIILLDEPTSFLDYKNKRIVLEKMIQLAEKRCVIFSSHDLEMVHKTMNNFLIVNKTENTIQLTTDISLENILSDSLM